MSDIAATVVSQPNHSGDTRFATALRTAVFASGLGLERIQQRMRARGSVVSVATLSYWQSGRSMPGRRESFVALAQLETVLGLSSGSLMTVVPTRNSGSRGVDSVGRLASMINAQAELPEIFAALDARLRRSIEMVSDQIVMTVGADRRQHTARNQRIVRALTGGVDRVILLHHVEDDSAALPVVEAQSHCTVGERHVLAEHGVVLTELIFDAPLEKGESIVLDYSRSFGPPYPTDSHHHSHRQLPLREFVIEVRFDPVALPTAVEWRDYDTINPNVPRRTTGLRLNGAHAVTVVRHEVPAGRHGLQWYWD